MKKSKQIRAIIEKRRKKRVKLKYQISSEKIQRTSKSLFFILNR